MSKWMRKSFAIAMMGMLAMSAVTVSAEEEPTAGVVVEANEASKTGYTAKFTFIDENATNVQVMGSFDFYKANDENLYSSGVNLAEGDSINNYTVSWENWDKDADLWHVGLDVTPVDMEEDGDTGVWTCSVDLPGGSYVYRYNVSYNDGAYYQLVMDPGNPPAVSKFASGDKRSEFFVPYDSEKQGVIDDWTFIAPVENAEDKGTVMSFSYISKDDVVRPALIYLPAGYDAEREEPYKVLYLSHGGGGSDTNWFHQGHADEIMDRLVAEGKCEPFIIVTMNNQQFNWDYPAIYENLNDYLIPYMEAHYNVSAEVSGRAHAGLSMGSMTTSTLLFLDQSQFGYYGMFSGSNVAEFPEMDDYSSFDAPELYIGVGFADNAYINSSYQTDSDRTSLGLAEKFDELGISYNDGNGMKIVQGGHDWYTWDQLLKDYILTTLWK